MRGASSIYGPVNSPVDDISSVSDATAICGDGDKPANLIAIRADVRWGGGGGGGGSADVPVAVAGSGRRLRIFHNYPCEIAVL